MSRFTLLLLLVTQQFHLSIIITIRLYTIVEIQCYPPSMIWIRLKGISALALFMLSSINKSTVIGTIWNSWFRSTFCEHNNTWLLLGQKKYTDKSVSWSCILCLLLVWVCSLRRHCVTIILFCSYIIYWKCKIYIHVRLIQD